LLASADHLFAARNQLYIGFGIAIFQDQIAFDLGDRPTPFNP